MPDGLTAELAGFAERTHVPEDVQHAARRAILNTLSLAIGASQSATVSCVARVASASMSSPDATVFGRAERVSAPWAALVNAVSSHVEDFDDTHLATVVHPGAPTVPAAFAVGELLDAGFPEVVEAVAVGMEVMIRIASALAPGTLDRGWHVTGVFGPAGAAAASARLLRLDRDGTERALGSALLRAAGVQSSLGSMVKAFHPGRAAFNGCLASLLVSSGGDGPHALVERPGGLAEHYAGMIDPARATDGLGETWAMLSNAFKPYACGIVSHPAIDAARELGRRVEPGTISRIQIFANPLLRTAMGLLAPTNSTEAKFSASHAVAVGVLHDGAGPEQFEPSVVIDPQVARLRRTVRIVDDETIDRDAVRMRATLLDHRVIDIDVPHARGSIFRPLTDKELRTKAFALIDSHLGRRGADLVDMVFDSTNFPVRRLATMTR